MSVAVNHRRPRRAPRGARARWRRSPIWIAGLLAAIIAAGPAAGYDTGPHFDITRDALATEGFGEKAIQIAQVSNWMIDLYENAESTPFSGHASNLKIIVGGAAFGREHWADNVVKSADRSHFDQTEGGFPNTVAISAEWLRLQRNVGRIAREARDKNDPQMLDAIIGMSLHQVEDFYSHTNWVEPAGSDPARRGPGWETQGWGRTPTWFDIPAPVRDAEDLYSAGSTGRIRNHGGWNADGNKSLAFSMAKDWPGRPMYAEAHIASYFAARQWVQALRAYVADDAFWNRAMSFSNAPGSLALDQKGATNISVASGHWQGQGEACNPSITTLSCGSRVGPGGNLVDLRGAVKDFFSDQRSRYRILFERLVVPMAAPNTTDPVFPVASSQTMQGQTRFVKLQVTKVAQIDDLDTPGSADFFARAKVAGQSYLSAVIHNHDSFGFKLPNSPFTWIKALPKTATFGTPVDTITVRIRTGSARGGGTDDDVYLRINDGQRFALDKRLYDDFERNDDDTYGVPIDDAVSKGLRVGDIQYIQIEKSKDGLAGAWRLADVTVAVNGVVVSSNLRIDRWLSGGTRTWRSPTFAPTTPTGPGVPVFLQLWELDASIRGDNDHTDTNAYDRRKDNGLVYQPDTTATGTLAGASRLKGRLGDGERASLNYRITTENPVLSRITPKPPPPPGPALLPDLVITNFVIGTFTVTNTGTGPAGAFSVSVANVGTFQYTGLAAGASIKQDHGFTCSGPHAVTADSTSQVAESDETNNSASFVPIC